jgi:hypothetical protein
VRCYEVVCVREEELIFSFVAGWRLSMATFTAPSFKVVEDIMAAMTVPLLKPLEGFKVPLSAFAFGTFLEQQWKRCVLVENSVAQEADA